jgi:hypothetical protein
MRWLLAGGMRSFLAGYVGCALLIGLMAAIVAGPGALLVGVIGCVAAPFGLIGGMAVGIDPGWRDHLGWLGWLGWRPWGGRLVFMGLTAGLVALVIVGRRLEQRYPVPDGGNDTPRVPSARAVTGHLVPTDTWNRLIGRLATVPRKQLIGPALLVIAGAGFVCLGLVGVAMLGMLDA